MDFWKSLSTTYYGGVLSIMLGGLFVLWVINYPQKSDTGYQSDMKRWVVGIVFILIGITQIIVKLVGTI
jgi:hypothetical protein